MATEYRVETRQTDQHPYGLTGWWPESDHLVFDTVEKAERWLAGKIGWYANATGFDHRIVSREVTDWTPVES